MSRNTSPTVGAISRSRSPIVGAISRSRSGDRSYSAHTRGFTLVEVLVALTIFAVLGFTVSARVGDVVNQTFSLERRVVAHWVAENHVNRLRLAMLQEDDQLPSTGRDRERVLMGGREWTVETEVHETEYPLLRRVEVTVHAMEEGEEVGPVDTITAFLGRH